MVNKYLALGIVGFGVLVGGCDDRPVRSLEEEVNVSVGVVRDVYSEDDKKNDKINYVDLRSALARHEGFRDTAYLDTENILTVGVGFNLEKSGARDRIKALGLNYDLVCAKKQKVSKGQSYSLMRGDVETAVSDAKKYMGDGWDALDSDAKEILVNMSYNMGYSRLSGFENLKKALVKKDYEKASVEMEDSKWYRQTGNRSKELVKRMKNVLNED